MPNTKENGSLEKISNKEKEHRSGQMDPSMMAGGRTTKPMAKVDLFMRMEMSTMVPGLTIKLMDLGITFILTDPIIKENGRKICSMDLGSRLGQMVLSIMVTTCMDRNMALGISFLLMVQLILDLFLKTCLKATVNTTSMTVGNTKVFG
jgi:hypothetical protein